MDKTSSYLGFGNYLNQLSKLKSISKDKEVSFKDNIVAIGHTFCNISPEQNSRINLKEMKESLKVQNN